MENFKGREWSCDITHTRAYWGCFTCDNIRDGINHRIDLGIETEDGRGVAHDEHREVA